MTIPRLHHILLIFLVIICLAPSYAAAEETEDSLDLFSAFQQQSSTASRAPKPLSQTAENITSITASEIEALNAHTLADVLATIPGIQVQSLGGPGSIAFTFVQATSPFHVLVLLDGVPLNNSDNLPDVALIPARIIERVEIVKGAGSSAWGQALGGVINIITKSPEQRRTIGGTASASIGDRTTADTSGELTGSSGRLGYYLSGGYLGSNGLLPQRPLYSNNLYGKLTYDLPGQGKLWGTVYNTRANRGDNYTTLLDFKEDSKQEYLYATLGFQRSLTEQLNLEMNAYYGDRDKDNYASLLSDQFPLNFQQNSERVGGLSTKLVWRGEQHLLVGGIEYAHEDFKGINLIDQSVLYDRTTDRFGFFLNDTISLGAVTIIPGMRFDAISGREQFSPSLGATWQLSDKTLLRASMGKGYGFSVKDANWSVQKIWTTQVGIESSVVPYLLLKGTLFRNETWNVIDSRNLDGSIPERRIALGTELELRTVPVYNTSLSAGYLFADTTHSGEGSQVYSFARHTLQLALRYDDKTFRGMLTGRHIYWNAVPGYGGRYGGLLWDLHLGATLLKRENTSFEIFFSGHNLFNGAQYPDETQPNTGRWFEGGMRVRF